MKTLGPALIIAFMLAAMMIYIFFPSPVLFWINRTKQLYREFKILGASMKYFILSLTVPFFFGLASYVIHRIILLIPASFFSEDLIEMAVMHRGVFVPLRNELQSPLIWTNLVYGLIATPLAIATCCFILVWIIRYWQINVLFLNGKSAFQGEDLPYCSLVGLVGFMTPLALQYVQLFTGLQGVALNFLFALIAMMSALLFFFGILHLAALGRPDYRQQLKEKVNFRVWEENIFFCRYKFLFCLFIVGVILHIPRHLGLQFKFSFSVSILALILTVLAISILPLRLFSNIFNTVGVYLFPLSKGINSPLSATNFFPLPASIREVAFWRQQKKAHNTSRSFYSYAQKMSITLLVAGVITYPQGTGLFFLIGLISVGSPSLILYYLKGNTSPLGRIIRPTLSSYCILASLALTPFVYITCFPKPLHPENHLSYQGALVNENNELLYAQPTTSEHPSIAIHPSEIPPFLKEILSAQEDKYFFRQHSFWPVNNWHGLTLGGSNLNAQTVKNLIFKSNAPRDLARKFTELFTAYQLSIQLKPTDIMTLYLNEVSFNGGNGHRGIYNAAYFTFGKPLSLCSEIELFYLINTVRHGRGYQIDRETIVSFDQVKLHEEKITNKIKKLARYYQEESLISPQVAKTIQGQTISFVNRPYKTKNSAATNNFYQRLLRNQNIGHSAKYITTLDTKIQAETKRAASEFDRKFEKHQQKGKNSLYSAALVVDYQTGNILAHYSSPNAKVDLTNFANGAPVGSLFKPTVLINLLEEGYRINLFDGKRNNKPWAVNNYNQRNTNQIVGLTDIIAFSLNTPFSNLDEILQIDPIVFFQEVNKGISNLGIPPDNSINLNDPSRRIEHLRGYPLGTTRLTINSATQLIQPILHDGRFLSTHALHTRVDPFVDSLVRLRPPQQQVYRTVNAQKIQVALEAVLKPGGTGHHLRPLLPKIKGIMAKTGTTSGYRDGYTMLAADGVMVLAWVSYGHVSHEKLILGQHPIPHKSGGKSAGVLAALILESTLALR